MWRAKMQKPAPALLFIPYSATVKIYIWRLTVHSSAIILLYFDRLYNFFFFLSFSFSRIFFSLHFFPSSLCFPSVSGCRSGFVGLWGCWSGLDVVVESCGVADLGFWGCGVADLGWMWWWSRVGLPIWVGCGGLRFGLGVVVELWVWVWLWGCRWIEEGGEKWGERKKN